MKYVEYIQNGTDLNAKSTGWMINFNRYPTTGTMIEIKFKHQNSTTDGNSFFGCHKLNNINNYFRLFTYQSGKYVLDSPYDSKSRIDVATTFGQEVTLRATPAPNLSLTNVDTQQTSTAINTRVVDYMYPMALWYGYDGDSGLVVEGTQVYYIKIWEGNTLVMDLQPAVDNGVVGLYDVIGHQMYTNTGSQKVFTAGPDLSSISVEVSKTVLANTGETISIEVDCENAWTVTGNTFLTLSSTGYTGSTTITATAPSYSGATARTDTLTFTDSVSGDEVEITIKQKKYSTGQPVYLGGSEVTELYLGDYQISEAYLGDVQVYSSGPFMGLRVSPKTITFDQDTLSANLKVKSSESWTATTPAWITASTLTGDSGETIISLSTTAQTAVTAGTIEVTTANYSASTSCDYSIGTPYLDVVGVLDISTDFYPGTFYRINNNYLKLEAAVQGKSSSSFNTYLYSTIPAGNPWFSLEGFSTNGTPYPNMAGTTGMFNGPTGGGGKNTPWTITVNNGQATSEFDGVVKNTRSVSGNFPDDTKNLCFFPASISQNSNMRFYWLKVWDANGNLAKHFVPNTNNTIMDKVSGTVYTVTGSGTATYGLEL